MMYPKFNFQVSYILRRYMENKKSDTRCNIQVNSVSIVNFTVTAETFSSFLISVALLAESSGGWRLAELWIAVKD